jgi:hypothetical protein
MVTALPTITVSALYVLYDACRRSRRHAEERARARRAAPAPDPTDPLLDRRLTILTFTMRR